MEAEDFTQNGLERKLPTPGQNFHDNLQAKRAGLNKLSPSLIVPTVTDSDQKTGPGCLGIFHHGSSVCETPIQGVT